MKRITQKIDVLWHWTIGNMNYNGKMSVRKKSQYPLLFLHLDGRRSHENRAVRSVKRRWPQQRGSQGNPPRIWNFPRISFRNCEKLPRSELDAYRRLFSGVGTTFVCLKWIFPQNFCTSRGLSGVHKTTRNRELTKNGSSNADTRHSLHLRSISTFSASRSLQSMDLFFFALRSVQSSFSLLGWNATVIRSVIKEQGLFPQHGRTLRHRCTNDYATAAAPWRRSSIYCCHPRLVTHHCLYCPEIRLKRRGCLVR